MKQKDTCGFIRQEKSFKISETNLANATAALGEARKEADMRSSYVVVHVPPHAPDVSVAPNRAQILLICLVTLSGIWMLSCLIYVSVRERTA